MKMPADIDAALASFLYERFGDAYFARQKTPEYVTRHSQIDLDERHTSSACASSRGAGPGRSPRQIRLPRARSASTRTQRSRWRSPWRESPSAEDEA